jgi:hypothetical protein
LDDEKIAPDQEEPGAKAERLTERLCGLLKEELAEYGGGDAFLRWVRSEDEKDAWCGEIGKNKVKSAAALRPTRPLPPRPGGVSSRLE